MGKGNNNNIGAIWQGEKYHSGSIECPHCNEVTKIVIFKNDYKTEDKHPDLNILKSTSTGTKEAAPKKTAKPSIFD